MQKSKLNLFLENFIVYGVGGIIQKIIPLIMVPIVTRIMPDASYYGINDLSDTIKNFGSALAIMGMYDAMYRMFFEEDKEQYKIEICSTALTFTTGTSVVIFVLMCLFKNTISKFVFKDIQLGYLVYITAIATLVGATNSIVSAPTRMQNKKLVFLILNTVSPVLSYCVSIPLLLKGYYIIALPIAGVICGFASELVFLILNKRWFSLKKFQWNHLNTLLKFAVPLLPNFLIYWIFNSCDKLMIVHYLGTDANGIYSIGSKLGHASQLIYTAFAGGWQFFAFSTMKEENQVKNNSLIFEYLGVISFVCGMFIFVISETFYKLLFTEEYVPGYICAPYLFLSPLMLMLFQTAANQFLVVKKTWPSPLVLLFGAGVNVLLNWILIPKIGIEGAAIATLIGYICSDIICVIVLAKMKLHIISRRFVVTSLIMFTFVIVWRLFVSHMIFISLLIAVAFSAFISILYWKDIKRLLGSLKPRRIKNV